MRNITVSIPDNVYRAARVRAAELDTSISALVAEYLVSLSRNEAEFAGLEELQHRIAGEIVRFRTADRLERADLHDRELR
jgi:hypothetical protein